MLPKTSKDFEKSLQSEKVDYLLSHPIPHVFAVGEVSSLKGLRDIPPDANTPEFKYAEQFIEKLFTKLQKTSYTRWQKLLDMDK